MDTEHTNTETETMNTTEQTISAFQIANTGRILIVTGAIVCYAASHGVLLDQESINMRRSATDMAMEFSDRSAEELHTLVQARLIASIQSQSDFDDYCDTIGRA